MPNSRFLPLLLALPACSDTYDFKPDPGFGELGVGVFLYRCPFGGDPHCANGEDTATQFPRAFALGGRINLRYDWRDDDDEHFGEPLPQLQSAASSLLVRQGDGFTALVPGYAAVLAVTGNSQVVDLRHLHIREIDSLQIVPGDGDMTGSPGLSELDLAPGDRPGLQAIALDSDDVLLGGVLGYTWTTADPAVVAILAGSEGGLVRLEALTPGATVLTLSQGELSLQLPITVTDEPITSTDDSGSSGATDSSSGDTGDTGGSSSESSGDSSGDSSGSTGGAL